METVNINKHYKMVHYQNILHMTLMFGKYDVKGFFKKIEEDDVDIDPDSLIDGTDSSFNTEFNRNLVKIAKERLYPYRADAERAPDIVNAAIETREEKYKMKEAKQDDKITFGDILFSIYDAPRRMRCFMAPFGTFKNSNKQEQQNNKSKDDTNKEVVEVLDMNGETIEAVIETPKNTAKQKVFVPVNGVVNIDVQKHFDNIIQNIKDRVEKGTNIDVLYNNSSGSFTAKITFPNGVVNNLNIDACTYLPDYYSIMVTSQEFGTIAVPFEDPISIGIIRTPMFQITKEQAESVLRSYYLNDIGLYYVFDFANFKGMNKMGKKTKKKLNEILLKLTDSLKDKTTEDIPRFRISEYNNINDFEITSDDKCRSPLAYINETSSWIANVTFKIINGVAQQVANDVATETVIA